jgi:hypothetical protein
MKKKKKKLVKYQGTKNSIVNQARDAASSFLKMVPKPKIQGITGTTNVDFPTPKSRNTSDTTTSTYKKKVTPISWNPKFGSKDPYKMKAGGSITKWTRNTSNGSRRCK